jgi:hypothetical protein
MGNRCDHNTVPSVLCAYICCLISGIALEFSSMIPQDTAVPLAHSVRMALYVLVLHCY